MKNANVEGIITKFKKIWWIKINKKSIKKYPTDGAVFPFYLKVKYTVNKENYEKTKIVCWKNFTPKIGDKINVVYEEKRPSKIISLKRK